MSLINPELIRLTETETETETLNEVEIMTETEIENGAVTEAGLAVAVGGMTVVAVVETTAGTEAETEGRKAVDGTAEAVAQLEVAAMAVRETKTVICQKRRKRTST